MSSEGVKYDQGKLRYGLIPPGTIEELAKLMNCSVQNIYQKIKRN